MDRGRARDNGRYYRPGGRSSRSTANSEHRHGPVGSDGSSGDVPLGQKDKVSPSGRQTSSQASMGSISKQFDPTLRSDYAIKQDFPSPDVKDISSNMRNLKLEQNSPEVGRYNTKQTDGLSASGSKFWNDFPSLSAQRDTTDKHQNTRKTQSAQPSDGGSERHSALNFVCCSAAAQNEASLLAESVIKDVPSKKETERGSPEVVGYNTKQTGGLSASGSKFWNDFPSLSAQRDPTDKHQNTRKTQSAQPSDGGSESHSALNFVCCSAAAENEASLLAESVIKDVPSKKETERGQTSHEKTGSTGRSENSDYQTEIVPFDICRERTGSGVKLKAPLLVKNREKRKEIKRSMEGQDIVVYRSGMVHLKSYLSHIDQVKIINTCRKLGLGPGGFYQPEFRDGAKLHLKMMCLGKNWDPEISSYVELRLFDKAKPPVIPNEFNHLVKNAIEDSHAYLQKQFKERNVERVIPSMSPNICIVNFYANSGKLGLHQDKDESEESLRKKLPVVSFSIGDSAEFLYGDQRDVEKAEKVILESGDVLIFGGESRHIFHGVRSILHDTAPKALMEESNLRPGRLNLTFREY